MHHNTAKMLARAAVCDFGTLDKAIGRYTGLVTHGEERAARTDLDGTLMRRTVAQLTEDRAILNALADIKAGR